MLNLERLDSRLNQIKQLLSHLGDELTSLEGEYQRALQVAHRDDLTGLLKRNAFFKSWELIRNHCESNQEGCAIMMIDIDKFKEINDQFGHIVGDEVIKRVAELLKKYESSNATVGRFGGEEFIVGIRGNSKEVAVTAELIRRGIEAIPASKKFTVSIGVAHTQEVSYETKALMFAADNALYEAKNNGRNQVKLAPKKKSA